jgi:hypothetical protein
MLSEHDHQTSLGEEMKHNSGFIERLYNSGTNSDLSVTIIESAEENERNVLGKILKEIARGKIPITKQSSHKIGTSKMEIISKFKKKKTNLPSRQIKLLCDLAGAYAEILHFVFNDV